MKDCKWWLDVRMFYFYANGCLASQEDNKTVLQEITVTVAGEKTHHPRDFHVIATSKTW
jgi:hypothetical protein